MAVRGVSKCFPHGLADCILGCTCPVPRRSTQLLQQVRLLMLVGCHGGLMSSLSFVDTMLKRLCLGDVRTLCNTHSIRRRTEG